MFAQDLPRMIDVRQVSVGQKGVRLREHKIGEEHTLVVWRRRGLGAERCLWDRHCGARHGLETSEMGGSAREFVLAKGLRGDLLVRAAKPWIELALRGSRLCRRPMVSSRRHDVRT